MRELLVFCGSGAQMSVLITEKSGLPQKKGNYCSAVKNARICLAFLIFCIMDNVAAVVVNTLKLSAAIFPMQYKFDGIPQALSYGQNIEVSVKPEPESAILQLWKCDDKGNKQTMLNTDIATPASGKKTMQFKIPPKDNKYASKYSPSKYLLVANANTKGVGEGTVPADPAIVLG